MVFHFGQVELDEDVYQLRRGGVVQHLEPKVLDLLFYLARHRDRLVTKSELLDSVWPDVVVAESVLTRAVSLARAAVGDTARGQGVIETVSGRGYRFKAPVEVGAARALDLGAARALEEVGPPPPAKAISPARPKPRGPLAYAAAGCLLLLLLFLGWLTWPAALGLYMDVAGLADPPVNPPLPEQPSVAVLPFSDLGPDHGHAYLADGVADELTVGLGRFRELFVVARSSAFTYRGPAVDLRRAGHELGVRYFVEGSLRAADERAVVSAQLVDALTGFQLWSGRYERDIGDVLALQIEIASEILHALKVRIDEAEIARVAGKTAAAAPSAYAAYVLAQMHWYRFTREDNRRAEELLGRAVALDPEDPRAHALLASTHLSSYSLGWDASPGRLERGHSSALRAIELDPLSPRAYASLAAANLWMGRYEEAVATARRAVELGPNSDLCHGVHAMALGAEGRVGEAIESLNRALRLNPRHPSPYWMLLGFMYRAAGRDERAAAIWEQIREANPDMIPPRLALLSHYEEQGKHQEARALAEEILAINPDFTVDAALRLDPRSSAPETAELRRAQLKRAGIP